MSLFVSLFFCIFFSCVRTEADYIRSHLQVPDYFQVIKVPMDLSTIMTKINSHKYISCKQFLKDVDLITNNCLEYNPDRDTYDRLLRNRACELRDTAHAMIYADLDPEFEKMCEEIHESRLKRSECYNTVVTV